MLDTGTAIFWPNGSQAEFFSSQDYFPGALRRVLPAQRPTRLSLPNNGEVVIQPEARLAYIRLADAPEFFQSPVSDFLVEPLGKHGEIQPAAYNRPLSLRDLLWTAGFHSSQGRMDIHDESGENADRFGIVRMTQWPNLTRVPHSPNTMRICALLTRYPTSVVLIPRLLSIDNEEVCQVLSAASSAGILRSGSVQAGDPGAEMGAPAAKAASGRAYDLVRSLFNKIQGL